MFLLVGLSKFTGWSRRFTGRSEKKMKTPWHDDKRFTLFLHFFLNPIVKWVTSHFAVFLNLWFLKKIFGKIFGKKFKKQMKIMKKRKKMKKTNSEKKFFFKNSESESECFFFTFGDSIFWKILKIFLFGFGVKNRMFFFPYSEIRFFEKKI